MKPGILELKDAVGSRSPFTEQGHHNDNQSDNDCAYPKYEALLPGDIGKKRMGLYQLRTQNFGLR